MRRLPFYAALTAAVILLSACTQLSSFTAGQTGLGPVNASVKLCVSGWADDSPAPIRAAGPRAATPRGGTIDPGDGPNGTFDPCANARPGADEPGTTGQPLFAVRVPAGTAVPDTVSATSQIVGGFCCTARTAAPRAASTLTFAKDPDYTAQIAAVVTTVPGTEWVGYRLVGTMNLPPDGVVAVTANVPFTPPATPGLDSAPIELAAVVGDRVADDGAYPADRPTNCADDSSTIICYSDGGLTTVTPRDLVVSPPAATPQVPTGLTSPVAFATQYGGPADDELVPSYALSATTDIPGATATPDVGLAQVLPNRAHTLNLAVPAGTAPGTYSVTVTAAIGDQTRSATFPVTVVQGPPPPPPGPLILDVLPPAVTTANLFAAGVPAAVGCSRPCTASVDVLAYRNARWDRAGRSARATSPETVLVGRSQIAVSSGERTSTTVPLDASAAARLQRIDAFTLVVRVTGRAQDGTQTTTASTRKIRFRGVCSAAGTPRARCVR